MDYKLFIYNNSIWLLIMLTILAFYIYINFIEIYIDKKNRKMLLRIGFFLVPVITFIVFSLMWASFFGQP
jgi:hypothetical protein